MGCVIGGHQLSVVCGRRAHVQSWQQLPEASWQHACILIAYCPPPPPLQQVDDKDFHFVNDLVMHCCWVLREGAEVRVCVGGEAVALHDALCWVLSEGGSQSGLCPTLAAMLCWVLSEGGSQRGLCPTLAAMLCCTISFWHAVLYHTSPHQASSCPHPAMLALSCAAPCHAHLSRALATSPHLTLLCLSSLPACVPPLPPGCDPAPAHV